MAISERFGKATEQLSSDKLSMRIAGVYLLERLANDSPGDLGPITEVLSAFARDQASIQRCEATITPKGIQTGLDAQAVLSALGRMPRGNMRADLSGTCFVGMDLRGTNLSGLDFTGASFVGTRFTNVNFSGSILERAVLSTAQFDQTDLSGTKLSGADLFNARFKATTVAGADFSAANLTAADLSNITGLTMDQFQPPHYYTPGSPYNEPYAYCAANTRWPEGFTPPHCFEWVR
ncbi:pentapeptide repeat-containing protein [Nocardia fluminea]|uniref:pentapeptide repeat-containing protein n=1 Tax=Nocardia fluminea TaxID=134984 RepID=UPI00380E628E